MKMPKKTASQKADKYPISLPKRWFIFSSYARMHVRSSGGWGPACRPYQHVLQLLIENPQEGDESWTVYRDNENPRSDGKIVHKKWDAKTDWANLQKLDGKQLPDGWHKEHSVTERQFAVSSRWLTELNRVLSTISIPPIAGSVRPFSAEPDYKLFLWSSWQESEFSWKKKPPAAWKPLTDFFFSLLEKLRKHADGEVLFSPKELLPGKS